MLTSTPLGVLLVPAYYPTTWLLFWSVQSLSVYFERRIQSGGMGFLIFQYDFLSLSLPCLISFLSRSLVEQPLFAGSIPFGNFLGCKMEIG